MFRFCCKTFLNCNPNRNGKIGLGSTFVKDQISKNNNFSRQFSTSRTTKNHYELLGVNSSASESEIKKAYLQKCLKVHPDLNKDAKNHQEFVALTTAYDILKDKEKREHYDYSLSSNYYSPYGETDTNTNTNTTKRRRRKQQQPIDDYEDDEFEFGGGGGSGGFRGFSEEKLWAEVVSNLFKTKFGKKGKGGSSDPFFEVFSFDGGRGGGGGSEYFFSKGWKPTTDFVDVIFGGNSSNPRYHKKGKHSYKYDAPKKQQRKRTKKQYS